MIFSKSLKESKKDLFFKIILYKVNLVILTIKINGNTLITIGLLEYLG